MTTNATYSHLHRNAIEQLTQTDKERIKIIRAGSWMALPHAKAILAKMEELLEQSQTPRTASMLLVGESFSGKTTILEHFLQQHLPEMDPNMECSRCPVVMVEAPPGPYLSDFYSRILEALMVPYKSSASFSDKCTQVKKLFNLLQVKMLIIDEVQHLIAGSLNKQREFRQALKSLSNETKISIVATGIEESHHAFDIDPQLSSRFTPMYLPSWHAGHDMGVLLATLESRMPLKLPSNLSSPAIMHEIDILAEGTLGDICDLVRAAGVDAIQKGAERITLESLRKLGWIPPSKRRRYHRSL